MKKIRLLSRYDFLILIIISTISIILLIPGFFKQSQLIATITIKGDVVEVIELNSVSGYREFKLKASPELTVRVENGRICVLEAQCADKLCINCGWLQENGDMAVCLPAGVVVTVEGKEKADKSPDVITY